MRNENLVFVVFAKPFSLSLLACLLSTDQDGSTSFINAEWNISCSWTPSHCWNCSPILVNTFGSSLWFVFSLAVTSSWITKIPHARTEKKHTTVLNVSCHEEPATLPALAFLPVRPCRLAWLLQFSSMREANTSIPPPAFHCWRSPTGFLLEGEQRGSDPGWAPENSLSFTSIPALQSTEWEYPISHPASLKSSTPFCESRNGGMSLSARNEPVIVIVSGFIHF